MCVYVCVCVQIRFKSRFGRDLDYDILLLLCLISIAGQPFDPHVPTDQQSCMCVCVCVRETDRQRERACACIHLHVFATDNLIHDRTSLSSTTLLQRSSILTREITTTHASETRRPSSQPAFLSVCQNRPRCPANTVC